MKCRVCDTDEAILNHHVTPKSRGGLRRLPVMKGNDLTIECCSDCGNQLHMLFTNKELEELGLNVLNLEAMKKYIEWKKKHPGNHAYRASNKVKDWKKGHRG
jgi:hypothetical protein